MASNLVQYPGAGCVVEFMQGNSPQIAWVMEEQSGKLRLLLPNRREMPMPANRVLPWAGPRYDVGKSREDVVGILQAHKEKREKQAQELNPVDLWEMAQGEVEKASILWLAELAFTSPDVDTIAACGHALLACKTHFRFQPPEFEIFTAEVVETRRQTEEATREREALVGGGAEWFRLLWEARQARKPAPEEEKFAPPEPVRSRLARMLRSRIADPETQDDDALWKQVTKALPEDPHLPLLLAQGWGLVPEHYNYWMDRADYEPGDAWAAEYSDEIGAVREDINTRQHNKLLDEMFISIDSASTRDIDDAFHIEARPEGGWRVDVALACPALGWPFGSPLDKAVAHRATSIYLPEGDSHMMPECLGTDAYSLHAGTARPALVLRCEVDEDGAILSGRPEAAWVSLAANLHYPACEIVLDGGEDPAHAGVSGAHPAAVPDTPEHEAGHAPGHHVPLTAGKSAIASAGHHAEALRQALAMAEARQKYRVEQGAVIIERPDADFYLVGHGAETQVFYKESPYTPKAQLLVAEMMIVANAALAVWAINQGVPLLYRTQDVAVPREFAGVWSSAPDIARVVRVMAPASLETTPRPHAGMGLTAYSPVTSPLRRYPDLMNEAQVLHTLQTGAPLWTLSELSSLLPGLNMRLDAAGQVQRFRPRYWKYLYLQQQARTRGDVCCWHAVVAEENDVWCSISLGREQLVTRGKRALFGEKVYPGQELKVRLGKINPLRGDVSILGIEEA